MFSFSENRGWLILLQHVFKQGLRTYRSLSSLHRPPAPLPQPFPVLYASSQTTDSRFLFPGRFQDPDRLDRPGNGGSHSGDETVGPRRRVSGRTVGGGQGLYQLGSGKFTGEARPFLGPRGVFHRRVFFPFDRPLDSVCNTLHRGRTGLGAGPVGGGRAFTGFLKLFNHSTYVLGGYKSLLETNTRVTFVSTINFLLL